jgi:hypothetical protein
MSEQRKPRCSACRKVIEVVLSDVGAANDYLCLECSGATLEDFMEEGMTEEDEIENRVHAMRTFHGED